ncbi:MAG: hypothetical protein ACF8SC_09580 [Phycisphaerales bacterium JB037]
MGQFLEKEDAARVKRALVERYGLHPAAAQYDLVNSIIYAGRILPVAEFSLFRWGGELNEALYRIGCMFHDHLPVLVAWERDDTVEAMTFGQLKACFRDRYLRGFHEMVVFDRRADWFICTHDEGAVGYHLPSSCREDEPDGR